MTLRTAHVPTEVMHDTIVTPTAPDQLAFMPLTLAYLLASSVVVVAVVKIR